MSVRAVPAPTPLDRLREKFRTAYREYLEAGEQSQKFLSELRGRAQTAEELQKLLELQETEGQAFSRYNEARTAYVAAVFSDTRVTDSAGST